LILFLASPNIPVVGWIPVFLLYLVGVIYYATRCGVDDVVVGLSKIFDLVSTKIFKDKADNKNIE